MVAAGLAIILILPRFVPAVPSPLVAIAVLTAFVVAGGIDVTDVGDEGALPSTTPLLGLPSVPFSLETVTIVLPFSATLAAVGLLGSLMTARLVDDITDTPSDKARESREQGIANVAVEASST